MGMFFKMGEEMLVQILSNLPPKTLMRFKSISKSWYALISSPEFVEKHLYNLKHNKLSSCILLRRSVLKDTDANETEPVFSLLTFRNGNNIDDDHNDGGKHTFISNVEDTDIPLSMSCLVRTGESLRIVGHCDGIVCVECNYSEVFLWNPAIKESRLLPPDPYLPTYVDDWREGPHFRSLPGFLKTLGFGYDPKSNDYKVVGIGVSGEEECGESDLITYPPKAVVYTLGTDSWREIETDSLETETTNLWPKSYQIYFKGVCYWLGQEQSNFISVYETPADEHNRNVIILFDTSDEVFHDMLLPDILYEYSFTGSCYRMRLVEWDESIALFGFHQDWRSTSTSFGIWVMDESVGPKNNAWTKHLVVDIADRVSPLAFWNRIEILVVSEDERLFSYNLGTKTFKYLHIRSVPNEYAAVIYLSSLVSVTGR